MNRRVAFPFLTLSDSAVNASPWLVALEGEDLAEAGEFLADWDRSSSITLERTLRLDFGIAADDVGIPEEELSVAVVARIGTGPGRLPRLVVHTERREISSADSELKIALKANGESLSTVLDLFIEIVLSRAPAIHGHLSPARVGDRLWHDRRRTRLEGEEPRFPLELVDLHAMLGDIPAADAPWYLHWSPRDWSRDFHGAIRLFLNSHCEDIVRRVEDQDPLTLQGILADAMGQVCGSFLMEPQPDEILAGCEAGTVGRQAAAWLNVAWPGRDLAFARSVLENRPSEFRATFLALAELEDG